MLLLKAILITLVIFIALIGVSLLIMLGPSWAILLVGFGTITAIIYNGLKDGY